jgi:4-diphosphocytidyl-2C-methyl-D-erythritol kinase
MDQTPISSDAVSLLSIESLIINLSSKIDELKKQLHQHQETLNDVFENNADYVKKSEVAKAAIKEKSSLKAELLKNSQTNELQQKVKDLRLQAKEMQQSLSDYLQQYAQMSGSRHFEAPDGTLLEIIYTAHLAKKEA